MVVSVHPPVARTGRVSLRGVCGRRRSPGAPLGVEAALSPAEGAFSGPDPGPPMATIMAGESHRIQTGCCFGPPGLVST